MMKTLTPFIAASLVFLAAGCCSTPSAKTFKTTWSSFDQPSDHTAQSATPAGLIDFQGVDLDQVLKVYEGISGRTVIRGSLPEARINLRTQAALSRVQTLQMLDTVLAQNGIAMILSGDTAVKAVPADRTASESAPEIDLPWQLLPDSGSPMTRTVELKNARPTELIPMLQPLSKLPNSIVCINSRHLLILRDYSANIRQELQLLEKLDRAPTP